jgi:hypothetical protein
MFAETLRIIERRCVEDLASIVANSQTQGRYDWFWSEQSGAEKTNPGPGSWLNVSIHPSFSHLHQLHFKKLSCAGALRLALQLVAQRSVITPLQASLFALTFTGFDQVLQTARPFGGRLATLGAAFVPLHAQLVLALPGNRQLRELVLNARSHCFVFVRGLELRDRAPGSNFDKQFNNRFKPGRLCRFVIKIVKFYHQRTVLMRPLDRRLARCIIDSWSERHLAEGSAGAIARQRRLERGVNAALQSLSSASFRLRQASF